MGFVVHHNSYLRDPWNWIDFIVVILGLVEFLPLGGNASNFKALRTLRVLRPLRSINAVPEMRRLLSSLFSSLPKLAHAAAFLLFVIILFGILGTQLFSGDFYKRCRLTAEPVEMDGTRHWPIDEDID